MGSIFLFVILAIWSILAVAWLHPLVTEMAEQGEFDGCERCPRAFGSIAQSTLTMTQTIVAGDSWGVLAIPLIERHPWSSIIFVWVLCTVELGLMNLILAVVVDRAVEARAEDNYFQQRNKDSQRDACRVQMKQICLDLDDDNSGSLTEEELVQGATTIPEFRDLLKLMDVSEDELSAIFRILDKDRSGSISHAEFVEQLHRMRNGDQNTLLMLIKHDVLMVTDSTEVLKSSLNGLQASCDETRGILQQLLDKFICSTGYDAPASPPPLSATPATLEKLLVEPKVSADLERKMASRAAAMVDSCLTASPALIPTLECAVLQIQGVLEQAQKHIAGECAQAVAGIGDPAIRSVQPPQMPHSLRISADGDVVLLKAADGNLVFQRSEQDLSQEKYLAEPKQDVDNGRAGMLSCCVGPKRGVDSSAFQIRTSAQNSALHAPSGK